jgi:WD40 repeat protein
MTPGLLASGDTRGTICVHRPVTSAGGMGAGGGEVMLEEKADMVLVGHAGSVECLAWSPSGVLIVYCTVGCKVTRGVWNDWCGRLQVCQRDIV